MLVNDVNLRAFKPQLQSLKSTGHLPEQRVLYISGPCCRILDHSDWTVVHFKRPDSSSAVRQQDSVERHMA